MDLELNNENQASARNEGKSRLGKILEEKSKLNLSISKRSRRIHNGANRSGTGGSISVQRQTLRANNRALAKSLQQYKQELNHANNIILELTNERQALQIKCNALSHVAELKNVEIEKEVQQRMEKKIGQLKDLFSMIGHLAGQGIDTFWGEGSSRPSIGISTSRSSLDADKLNQVSPEALRAALQRSIYSNKSTQEANSNLMLRGSKPGDLSLVIEKSMLDEIGSLPFEEVSTCLATVSEIDELKRRSSSMQLKGRRSNLLDVESIRNFRVSGLRASAETTEESTPRTSDISNQRKSTSLEKSDSLEKSCEAIPRGAGEQNTHQVNTSKSPSEMPLRNPILDPDERPLDVATGRPAKATFTFIAFEKPKSPGLGNLAVKKGKSTLPRRDMSTLAKDKAKGKLGGKKSGPVERGTEKEKEVDPGKMLKLGVEKKPDEIAPKENGTNEVEVSESVGTEPEASRNHLKTVGQETFCVPEEKENIAKKRRGTFAVTKPDIGKKDSMNARRGTFAVTNQDRDLAGNTDIPGSDMQLNNLEESGNESLGILSTTILEEVDMEFTCAMNLDLASLPITELGNSERSEKRRVEPENDNFPADIPEAELEDVPDELEMDESAATGSQDSHLEELILPEAPDSHDSVTSEPCKADSSKSDESSDDGKKEKKFAVYHLKPGKIQFIAGRKDVNGDFKVPKQMPRSRSRALSRSKKSRSKQKSKPIELPISNPPSAYDFLGLTPEKPLTKGVFDMSCNESVDGDRLSLKEYRENKGGAIKIPQAKTKVKQEEVSTNEEGSMEFSDHKMKKRESASAARKCGTKLAKAQGYKRQPASHTNSEKADESIVVRSRGMRNKKKAVISSSSDTSFVDDDSNDEDFAPRSKSKLSRRTETRIRRETVTIAARSRSGGDGAAPVSKSSLKPQSGSHRQTVMITVPSAIGDEEPKKLNVTFEKPSQEGLENGREELDVESSNQMTKKSDDRAGKLTVSTSGLSFGEDNVPTIVNTTFDRLSADEVMDTTLEKPDAVNTTFEKPSVGDSEKVEENCEENSDHRPKKTFNRKVVTNKTRTKSKKVEDTNSDAGCYDDIAPSVKNKISSVRKMSRRGTAPEVEPPVYDDDAPTKLNGTFEIPPIVEPALSEDDQSKNQNETFKKLPVEGSESDSQEVLSNMKQGNTTDETAAEMTTISLGVPVPVDDDSFGDISNFWDKKTPAKKKEPVVVETEEQNCSKTKTNESSGNKETTGSLDKGLDVGEGNSHPTSELNENVGRKQKSTRKSAKSVRGQDVDLDTNAALLTEIEGVAKKVKKEPRSRRRTKRVSSKPDVTLGGLLNELTSGDQEDLDIGGMTVMLEELGGKLDIEATPESPVVKHKKRCTTRAALADVEINSPVPAVTIKKERRSSLRSTMEGQEIVNGDEQQPAKRLCRNRGAVSYKEPSLNVKMRQGYKLDIIKYDDGNVPLDDECPKKKKKVQKKKKSEVK
ncbi:uncharacterized protein LOC135500299 [Lineus longissimus]|uniref:uncharacterized protein LOC135500299 n=1 Tax=Lineus longissimus TaxID=88925 RepID=UPI00315D76CE